MPAGLLWTSHLESSPAPGGRTHLDHPVPKYQRFQPRSGSPVARQHFPAWEQVCDADLASVIAAIRPAGLANQKGPRIRQVLGEIYMLRGSFDLNFLKGLPLEEARAWLMKFRGVGPKTAAIVLLFSLDMPAFPVDTHIFRVTGRIGLLPERMTVEAAHHHLEELLPPDTYYAAHLNMIRLGRELCTARKPYCSHCPLRKLCKYVKLISNQSDI
jgi:endonuclease-3